MAKRQYNTYCQRIAVYCQRQYKAAILHGCTATHLFVTAMVHLQYFPAVLLAFL